MTNNPTSRLGTFSVLTLVVIVSGKTAVADSPNSKVYAAVTKAGGIAVRDGDGSITDISISESPFGDETGSLGKLQLRSLNASGDSLSTETILRLTGEKNLQRLCVSGPAVTDKLLDFIGGCKQMRSLQLSGLSITNNGLSKLSVMPELEDLRLLGLDGPFTDDGLRKVLSVSSPARLHVGGANVTGRCFRDILDIEKLIEVGFTGCPISNEGAAELSRANNLRSLSIEYGEITDLGLAALRHIPKLDHLVLNRNRIKGKSLGGFPSLSRLWVFDEPLEAHLLDNLGTMKEVRELKVRRTRDRNVVAYAYGDTIAIQASQCEKLADIELGNTGITDTGIRAMQNAKNLQCVRIENQIITREMLRSIAGLRSVHTISLRDCEIAKGAISELLVKGSIQELDLNHASMTDEDIDSLIAIRPMRLDVSETAISQRGLSKLRSELGNAVLDSRK